MCRGDLSCELGGGSWGSDPDGSGSNAFHFSDGSREMLAPLPRELEGPLWIRPLAKEHRKPEGNCKANSRALIKDCRYFWVPGQAAPGKSFTVRLQQGEWK